MAIKELRKMKRQDLLELLILQSRDVARLRADVEEKGKTIEDLQDTFERLKVKLNDKDAQIAHLKQRLDQKDLKIANMEGRIPAAGNQASRDDGSRLVIDTIYEAAQNVMKKYMDQGTAVQGIISADSDHVSDQAAESNDVAAEEAVLEKSASEDSTSAGTTSERSVSKDISSSESTKEHDLQTDEQADITDAKSEDESSSAKSDNSRDPADSSNTEGKYTKSKKYKKSKKY